MARQGHRVSAGLSSLLGIGSGVIAYSIMHDSDPSTADISLVFGLPLIPLSATMFLLAAHKVKTAAKIKTELASTKQRYDEKTEVLLAKHPILDETKLSALAQELLKKAKGEAKNPFAALQK